MGTFVVAGLALASEGVPAGAVMWPVATGWGDLTRE